MRPKTKRAGTNPPVGTGSVTFRSPTKVGRTGLSVPMLTSSATDVTTATLWDRITPAEVLLVRASSSPADIDLLRDWAIAAATASVGALGERHLIADVEAEFFCG